MWKKVEVLEIKFVGVENSVGGYKRSTKRINGIRTKVVKTGRTREKLDETRPKGWIIRWFIIQNPVVLRGIMFQVTEETESRITRRVVVSRGGREDSVGEENRKDSGLEGLKLHTIRRIFDLQLHRISNKNRWEGQSKIKERLPLLKGCGSKGSWHVSVGVLNTE